MSRLFCLKIFSFSFFFNDTASSEIYTLSLLDALPIFITAKVEDVVAIVGFNTSYTIERHYQFEGSVILDKVKLKQILVNLIRNAKDALMESKQENKK